MASSSLPIKLKLALRDHWDPPTSPLRTTLTTLTTLLGHRILLAPEWPLLHASLSPLYPDKTNLVLTLASLVQTLARSLSEVLDSPANETWTETLLERISQSGAGGLRITLDVGAAVGVTWSSAPGRTGFVLTVPGREAVVRPEGMGAVMRGGLVACFEETETVVPVTERGADEWADVEVDTATGRVDVVETKKQPPPTAGAPPPAVEFLPNVQSLPRPDELFLRAPYYLTVTAGHDGVEIHGSHSPSLKVVAEYFKKWCRVNHYDSTAPPAVQVTLSQSPFGLNEMFDRLSVSTKDTRYNSQFQVTAPMIVAFVEGVLGYELISDRGGWNFKRETEFKTSRY
ncbi:hypothetical protein QBC39DRAFT_22606 [Podospora conica]|nr:hypothetical protein QBC39DRAFT_22606 [Schizothecium conicum]